MQLPGTVLLPYPHPCRSSEAVAELEEFFPDCLEGCKGAFLILLAVEKAENQRAKKMTLRV